MNRNQHSRTMTMFIGMILISTVMSYYNVEAFGRNNIEDDYTGVKSLRQLLRQLQMDDDEESFLSKRVAAEGDCIAATVKGYQWDGEQSMSMGGIDTTQRCMDSCDLKQNCVGWSYDSKTNMCWGFSSINGVVKASDDVSGSCVGKSVKAKCTEKRNGQYLSSTVKTLEKVATVEACMASCDQLDICYGYVYDKGGKKCYLASSLGDFSADNAFISGACMVSQKRIRLAEPMKIFRKDALERHNAKRGKHCSPNLALDDNLNKVSQDLADKMARDDVMPPVQKGTGMQNVFYDKADAARSCASVVDCLYDERKYFDWDDPDFGLTNAFAKVIWKNSRKLGVGRAFASDNQTMYVVMSYDGKGDLADSYEENVPKECKQ